MKIPTYSALLAVSILISASPCVAQDLIDLDFEDGGLGNATIMSDGTAAPRAVSATEDAKAGGSVEESIFSLQLAEDPATGADAGYKPAVDFPLLVPEGDGELTVSFDFKQMSGDASGLAIEIIQRTGQYASWTRFYLGKNLSESMVAGPAANTSVIVKDPALDSGPEAIWHKIVLGLTRTADGASSFLEIDGVRKDGLPAYMFASPTMIEALRFSNEGAGPDAYFIDNLKVTWTPAS